VLFIGAEPLKKPGGFDDDQIAAFRRKIMEALGHAKASRSTAKKEASDLEGLPLSIILEPLAPGDFHAGVSVHFVLPKGVPSARAKTPQDAYDAVLERLLLL
jgi:hypothetical protein